MIAVAKLRLAPRQAGKAALAGGAVAGRAVDQHLGQPVVAADASAVRPPDTRRARRIRPRQSRRAPPPRSGRETAIRETETRDWRRSGACSSMPQTRRIGRRLRPTVAGASPRLFHGDSPRSARGCRAEDAQRRHEPRRFTPSALRRRRRLRVRRRSRSCTAGCNSRSRSSAGSARHCRTAPASP